MMPVPADLKGVQGPDKLTPVRSTLCKNLAKSALHIGHCLHGHVLWLVFHRVEPELE